MTKYKSLKINILRTPSVEMHLTEREVDTLKELMHGYTNKEIANKLGLSSRTIEYYLKNVRTKLDCASKRELIRLLLKTDFIQKINHS